MPTDQPKRSVWPTIVAGVVLLVVTYGGTYRLIVERSPFAAVRRGVARYSPDYPHESLEKLFRPAHRLDRQVRPQFWYKSIANRIQQRQRIQR